MGHYVMAKCKSISYDTTDSEGDVTTMHMYKFFTIGNLYPVYIDDANFEVEILKNDYRNDGYMYDELNNTLSLDAFKQMFDITDIA